MGTARNRAALVLEDVVVAFGGLVAVNQLSLRVDLGQAVGLIGPNGAGKTTTFNACSGLVQPVSGSIHVLDEEVTDSSPGVRARLGLGRTFQLMELYDRLTVEENVAMGLEAKLAGSRILGAVLSTRAERSEIAEATEHALERCGIEDLRHRRAGVLPIGQRRLVELARALAGDFRLLLLDEPSSGLDSRETEHFAAVVNGIVEDDGRGVLLVEHDMSLVRTVCQYCYVLDFGTLIAEGPTDEVLASDRVRLAYLGEEVA